MFSSETAMQMRKTWSHERLSSQGKHGYKGAADFGRWVAGRHSKYAIQQCIKWFSISQVHRFRPCDSEPDSPPHIWGDPGPTHFKGFWHQCTRWRVFLEVANLDIVYKASCNFCWHKTDTKMEKDNETSAFASNNCHMQYQHLKMIGNHYRAVPSTWMWKYPWESVETWLEPRL